MHPVFVSVNLSGRQVLDQNLVDDVKTIMSREDVAPGSLKLELTESMVMENAELSAQVLQKLRNAGVSILCDDFGTGYSSLSVLQRLPFDTIKLDRSFVMSDPEDDGAAVVLESIILLAHDLRMKIVAEGIETREQLERLREFECDFGQGYFFGEPLSARTVVETLGGKSSLANTRRAPAGRGLFGRLIKAPTREAEPARAPDPLPSRLKTDREADDGAAEEGLRFERGSDDFRVEVEARRMERLRRPTISAALPDDADDAGDDAAAEADEAPLLLEQPAPPEPAHDGDIPDAAEGSEAPERREPEAVEEATREAETADAGDGALEADDNDHRADDEASKPETVSDDDDAELFAVDEEAPVDLDAAAAEAARKAPDGAGEPGATASADAPGPLDDDEFTEHEMLIEEMAGHRRKASRLTKLLRRGRKSQPALEE
jgi:hypothetical protein